MAQNFPLSDAQILSFIINGYMLLEPAIEKGVHESIHTKCAALKSNPGNGIYEAVPELRMGFDHPQVRGALAALLGDDYRMSRHRHMHAIAPGTPSQGWHQDDVNVRHHSIRRVLAMYYPHDVTAEMGPTIILPGTQYRNAPTDRMATYANMRGQLPLIVKSGTIAITHYDLWHAGTVNRSNKTRYMLKFLMDRVSDPLGPCWNHDPSTAEGLAYQRLNFEDPTGGLPQSDAYKLRGLRFETWNYLLGRASAGAAGAFDQRNP